MSIKRVSEKQRKRLAELEKVNRLIWKRDGGKCISCQSTDIVGEPFRTGSHHVFSRNAYPQFYLDPRFLCLLCRREHGDEANTVKERKRLLKILQEKYNYEYPEPELQWYLEE